MAFYLGLALMFISGLALVLGLANFKLQFLMYYEHGWVVILTLPAVGFYLYRRGKPRILQRGIAPAKVWVPALLTYAGFVLFCIPAFFHKNVSGLDAMIENESLKYTTVTELAEFDTAQPVLDIRYLADSEACQSCHPEIYRQWQYSTHRFAGRNRVYLKALERLSKTVDPKYVRHCDNCHDPGLCFDGSLSNRFDPEIIRKSEGVSCKVCHLITDFDAHKANGSFTVIKEFRRRSAMAAAG